MNMMNLIKVKVKAYHIKSAIYSTLIGDVLRLGIVVIKKQLFSSILISGISGISDINGISISLNFGTSMVSNTIRHSLFLKYHNGSSYYHMFQKNRFI